MGLKVDERLTIFPPTVHLTRTHRPPLPRFQLPAARCPLPRFQLPAARYPLFFHLPSASIMLSVDCSDVTDDEAILPSKEMDDLVGEDRITELPDDIMLTILFQLEMKVAAKTSILSKRWRYLWSNRTDLDFDHMHIIPKCHNYRHPKPIEEAKYLNWVNQVISLHDGQSINKFRVRFGFDQRQVHNIERWVRFALSKRVKTLDLELLFHDSAKSYTLKSSLLDTGISFLTCLRLTDVKVSGELLEFVLAESHLLECLFVEGSEILVTLKVASLKLKHLSILNCVSLKTLEIDAVNLGYLNYFGEPIIEFKNLPQLVEATFNGECCGAAVPICEQISSFAEQLSKFLFRVMINFGPEGDRVICNIPTKGLPCFSNLKFLELTYWLDSIVDLPSIIRLVGACPVLYEFKLQVCWHNGAYIPKEARVLQGLQPLSPMNWGAGNNYIYDHSKAEDEIEYKALLSLRVFQLVGFSGGDYDVDLALIILDMAVQLQTFICHPLMPSAWWRITKDMACVCRRRATKLEWFVAPKVNYVITNKYDASSMI